MKKNVSLLVFMLCAMSLFAYDFEKDGIYYNYLDGIDGDAVAVTYGSYDNMGAYNFNGEYTGSIDIPPTVNGYDVTTIGDYAFSQSALTDITLPSSITTIGHIAFNCNHLAVVNIPNSVTTIANAAFFGCLGLTAIAIPESVTTIGYQAFSSCPAVETITVAAGNPIYHSVDSCLIETATKTLHTGCKNSIIPADGSVTKIGDCAFQDCMGLTELALPDAITSIGGDAFMDCSNVIEPIHNQHLFAYMPPSYSGDYTIPDGIQTIAIGAFLHCPNLTGVTLPNSVTTIGPSAFAACSSLRDITFSNNLTTIGNGAFYGCSGLTAIILPKSVTEIGDQVFVNHAGLETIIVEEGNPIYHSAGNCLIEKKTNTLQTGCKKSIIPDDGSVTNIGSYAFYGCSGLTDITIPNRINRIDFFAFAACSSLATVTIGRNVNYISDRAFENCSNLAEIICLASAPPSLYIDPNAGADADVNVFSGVPTTATITVPCDATAAYKAAKGWSDFTNYEEELFFAFSATSADNTQGSVTISQEPTCTNGAVAIVEAKAATGFKFKKWSDGNEDNPRTIDVTRDIALTAEFESAIGVEVVPSDKTADVYWNKIEGAVAYMANVYKAANNQYITGFYRGTDIENDRISQKITGLAPETTYIMQFQYAANGLSMPQEIEFTTLKEIIYTGADQVEYQSTSVRKVFENGTMYIIRGDEKYTIDGIRVI